MTHLDFIGATYGTQILTGTDAITGSWAGFKALGNTVINAISINGSAQTPATYLGSATIADGAVITVPYATGIFITSIDLTSGSLLLIKGS